jgi:hypothetical protein
MACPPLDLDSVVGGLRCHPRSCAFSLWIQTTTPAWWPTASNYRRRTADNELHSLRLASPVRGTRKAQSVRPQIARPTPESRDGPTCAPRCRATRRTPTYGALPSPVPLPQVVLRKIARGSPRSFRVEARTIAPPQLISLSQAKRLAAFNTFLCILRYQIHNILCYMLEKLPAPTPKRSWS